MYGISILNSGSKGLTTNNITYTNYSPRILRWEVYDKVTSPRAGYGFYCGGVSKMVISGTLPDRTILGIESGSLYDVYVDGDGNTIIMLVYTFFRESVPRVYFFVDRSINTNSTLIDEYGLALANSSNKYTFFSSDKTLLVRGIVSKGNKTPIMFTQPTDYNKIIFLQSGNDGQGTRRFVDGGVEYIIAQTCVQRDGSKIYVQNMPTGVGRKIADYRGNVFNGADPSSDVLWLIAERMV